MKTLWSFIAHVSLLVVVCLANTVESLDCYQCSNSDEETCTTTTTTCSAGEVCSNKVFRRYTLTTVYDKGCLGRSACYALENLNTDRYCSVTPSTCTYCCGSNLCNGARTSIAFKATHWWYYLTVLTAVSMCSLSSL